LYLILESLKKVSAKKKVIIPAYICPSVAMAVLRAGLDLEVCDINGSDFNLDAEKLEEICGEKDDILAVVAAHLGGIPFDFDKVQSIVKGKGIFIIEDCAQALGAGFRGRKVGTLGDFSFFSLAKGKGLTIYEGGVIVANSKEYASIIDDTISRLVKKGFFAEILRMLGLFGYAIFYRPRLFWFVYRLPELFWHASGQHLKAISEYFSVDFPVHRVSKIRGRMGHMNFCRLDAEITRQRETAAEYIKRLEGIKGIKVIMENRDSIATYPFVTLLFEDAEKRNRILGVLKKSGAGVSELYTSPVTDYEYLKGKVAPGVSTGARHLAERQIILSTSIFLKPRDMDTVVELIRKG